MKREIKTHWRKENGQVTLTVVYLLIGKRAAIGFTVRAPTTDWNYWLPMGIDYHAKEPQYTEHTRTPCTIWEEGYCYCDGTSLGAEKLWDKLLESRVENSPYKMDEEVIWKELEDWLKVKFSE